MKSMRPRVFLSSTIKDFFDLRSALRWWLEELGFDVQANEYNDFDKPPDQNAINACLDVVRSSDYYILLIGDRKGCVLPNDKNLSITRLEYRTAFESHCKNGRPLILSFLRSDTHSKISQTTPSIIDSDLEFTRGFIQEIEGKTEQNWVRHFNSFRDIVQALQIDLNAKNPIIKKVLVANLIWELEINMKSFFQDLFNSGQNQPQHFLFPKQTFQNMHFSSTQMASLPITTIPKKDLFLALTFLMSSGDLAHLHISALENAISSGEFLEYKLNEGSFSVGQTQEALLRLRTDIRQYQQWYKISDKLKQGIPDLLEKHKASDTVPVPFNELFMMVMLYNLHVGVFNQMFHLLQYFYGLTEVPKVSTVLPLPIFGEKTSDTNKKSDVLNRDFIRQFITKNPNAV